MSAIKVTNVQFSVDATAALVIRSLLYRLNWSEDAFKFASTLTTEIEALELEGDVDLDYNFDTEEFDLI